MSLRYRVVGRDYIVLSSPHRGLWVEKSGFCLLLAESG